MAMLGPLVAIVGDLNPTRVFDPPMLDAELARRAAEELGRELARRHARLLVYGGPFLEADVVRGFVLGKPAEDRCIFMNYSREYEPEPFPEETSNPKLFERRSEKGADWEVAFYRSVGRADGIILLGGGNATKIAGQVAIGTRMPILALPQFGGGAAKVWETLSAGEDLPTREDINLMARRWTEGVATEWVRSLFAQHQRRKQAETVPPPIYSIVAAVFFLTALSIVPLVWGKNSLPIWMLFLAPLLAGGAGAAIRPMVDRLRGAQGNPQAVLATVVLGLLAGGIAGILFVTAQLTANPMLAASPELSAYAQRSIPFAVGVGFVAGLTSDVVFGKLLGLEVVQASGISNTPPQA